MELEYETISGKVHQLPIPSPLPTQSQIRNRMAEGYGQAGILMKSFFFHCSAVAEKIMLEIYNTDLAPSEGVNIAPERLGGGSGRIRLTGYCCPRCHCLEIRHEFNYCPKCGIGIIWNENAKKAVKGAMPTKGMAFKGKRSRPKGYSGRNQVYHSQR